VTRMQRRWSITLLVIGLVCTAFASGPAVQHSSRPMATIGGVNAYRGLGTWVDVYDYSRPFSGVRPPVSPSTVDRMAAQGIKTIFLQAAMNDRRSPNDLVDSDLLGAFLQRAHAHRMNVVGWYLPKFVDLDTDMRHIRAIRNFRVAGQRFDGLALDLEDITSVPDLKTRNERLVQLSSRARAFVGGGTLGAIVLPPVQLEVVAPNYWPAFPWRRLRPFYDAWLPMSYFTFRSPLGGGYRDAYKYTEESVRRLRNNLGFPFALVHVIGGIADVTTPGDVEGLRRTVWATRAVGWSLYDYNTTKNAAWPQLRTITARR
jgi:hypothetical protein